MLRVAAKIMILNIDIGKLRWNTFSRLLKMPNNFTGFGFWWEKPSQLSALIPSCLPMSLLLFFYLYSHLLPSLWRPNFPNSDSCAQQISLIVPDFRQFPYSNNNLYEYLFLQIDGGFLIVKAFFTFASLSLCTCLTQCLD